MTRAALMAGVVILGTIGGAAAQAQLDKQHGMAGYVEPMPDRADRPAEPTLTDEQRAWIDRWRAQVYLLDLDWDDAGRITQINFSNHQIYRADQPEKPGVANDAMAGLLAFPELRSVGWEKQRVTTEGVQVLRQIPHLEEVRFHYMAVAFRGTEREGTISPDFMLVVDGHPTLRVLELKHLFALRGTAVDRFEEGLPNLRYMEADCDSAGPELLTLIAKSPKLEGLELHRTTLTDGQFAELLGMTPHLRYLELKPVQRGEDYIRGTSLRHLAKLPGLEYLRLSHGGWKPLTYDDGLEHLVPLKQLKTLQLTPKSLVSEADLQRLRAARPDLEIR